MADFRKVVVAALKWFPLSRKTIPVTPVRVQTPPCRCSISLLPGRYALDLTLSGHEAHPAFATFVADVEAHALESPHAPRDLAWRSCVAADALVPSFRVSAFDDTAFFDTAGKVARDPTGFGACACLLELVGAWTSDTHWGLRWKVLEVKEHAGVEPACMIEDDDDDALPVT